MDDQPAFTRVQRAFAAHIRDPEHVARPADVEERRMAIYRDLFYNNVESLLAANFPVLKRVLNAAHWHDLMRGFFVRHRCTTPLFNELGQEFLEYLQHERENDPRDPPFLLELAHYEWVELAVSIADEAIDMGTVDPNGDLITGCPVISSLVWNLNYRYPVHQISPDFLPDAPGTEPTCLIVYRNRRDKVEFIAINPITQRLLVLVQQNPSWTGLEIVTRVAEELNHPQPGLVVDAGTQMLRDLRARNVFLGTRRHN